jgi:hypothetical protein
MLSGDAGLLHPARMMTRPRPGATLGRSRWEPDPGGTRRREVSVTAPAIAPEDGGTRNPPDAASFLAPLVERLHAEYGADRQTIRALAMEALAGFAGARVQAFVPILVEKRLRQACRALG